MTTRIELVVGERIPLSKGGLSELVYLGEVGSTGMRKVLVRCVCGAEWACQLGNVRSGHTSNCPKCWAKGNQSDWLPGHRIGPYVIITRLANSSNGNQRYRVLNHRTGNINATSQSNIQRTSTELGYLTYLIRSRIRKVLGAKGIRKTKSAIRGLPWTAEDILAHTGPKPEGCYHLEHSGDGGGDD